MSAKLSVCIANYQGEAVITRCLDSLTSQSCNFEFEILIHDDASTDASCEIIASRYPGVKLLRSHENVGFCKSNNRLAEEAGGDYILLLNNDTRVHPGGLQALIDAAESDPAAGVLSLPQYDMDSGELLDRGMFIDVFANPVAAREPTPEVAVVMGSCLLIRRDTWLAIGGFPEWFGSLAEDLYLCTRVRLLGLRVKVIDRCGYDHVVGHSFGGGKVAGNRLDTTFHRRRLSELNKNRVIATCYPAPVHIPLLGLQFLLLLLEGALLSLAKRSARPLREIYLPSIGGILTDIPRLRRERKRCMENRQIGLAAFFSPIRFRLHKLSLLRRHGVPSIS